MNATTDGFVGLIDNPSLVHHFYVWNVYSSIIIGLDLQFEKNYQFLFCDFFYNALYFYTCNHCVKLYYFYYFWCYAFFTYKSNFFKYSRVIGKSTQLVQKDIDTSKSIKQDPYLSR